MSLSNLLRRNLIEQQQSNSQEINSKVSISESNLRSAKKTVQINDPDVDDTTYKEAYNAILETGYALMYSRGYKPKDRRQHHYIVEQFVKCEFSNDFSSEVLQVFGQARSTRSILQYDNSGVISHDD